jgi:hypothetical protein
MDDLSYSTKEVFGKPVSVIGHQPLKPGFGLSGAVLQPDRVFPLIFRAFVSSISNRSPCVPRPRKTQGPSTPQIIALRRSAPVGMTELGDLNIPTQAKIGLEWGTRPSGPPVVYYCPNNL